jgi:zinc protease
MTVATLSYAEDAFKDEAGAAWREHRKNRPAPSSPSTRRSGRPKHTYGHTTMGYEKEHEAMPTMYAYL